MKQSALCALFAMFCLTVAGRATVLTLSGSRAGPIVVLTDNTVVSDGLVRVGTLNAVPASHAISDIDAVFEEFATGFTLADGRVGQTFNNGNAAEFNGEQIYLWVFDTADQSNSQFHAVFTAIDPNSPSAGDPWIFPVHIGSGTDSATVSLGALITDGIDLSITPGVGVDPQDGGRLVLPIPEPSTAVLGISSLLFLLRRRR